MNTRNKVRSCFCHACSLRESACLLCCAVENICVMYCISTFTADTNCKIGIFTLTLPLARSHCLPHVALLKLSDSEELARLCRTVRKCKICAPFYQPRPRKKPQTGPGPFSPPTIYPAIELAPGTAPASSETARKSSEEAGAVMVKHSP